MKRAAPAARDLHARRPVWLALSTLFLDTDIDAPELARLARVLAVSRYPPGELEWILHVELAPVLAVNLRVAAGVWEGFDPAWLEQRVLARQAGWSWPWRRWLAERWPRRCEDWPALRRAIDLALARAVGQRPRTAGSDPA